MKIKFIKKNNKIKKTYTLAIFFLPLDADTSNNLAIIPIVNILGSTLTKCITKLILICCKIILDRLLELERKAICSNIRKAKWVTGVTWVSYQKKNREINVFLKNVYIFNIFVYDLMIFDYFLSTLLVFGRKKSKKNFKLSPF